MIIISSWRTTIHPHASSGLVILNWKNYAGFMNSKDLMRSQSLPSDLICILNHFPKRINNFSSAQAEWETLTQTHIIILKKGTSFENECTVGKMLDLSWPAVSQICALTSLWSMTSVLVRNSTPIVGFDFKWNSFFTNRFKSWDFPTPESPTITILNM